MKAIAIFALALAGSGSACAGMFGSSNFAECVLSRMPGVANDTVALEISAKCSREFPADVSVEKQTGFLAAFSSGAECTVKKARDTVSTLGSRIIQAQCYRLYETAFDPSSAVIVDPQPTTQHHK